MNKKLLSLVLVAALAMSLLAGCGSKEEPKATTAAAADTTAAAADNETEAPADTTAAAGDETNQLLGQYRDGDSALLLYPAAGSFCED